MLSSQLPFCSLASQKLFLAPNLANRFSNSSVAFDKNPKSSNEDVQKKDDDQKESSKDKPKNMFQKFLSDIKKSKQGAVKEHQTAAPSKTEMSESGKFDDDITKFVQQLANNPQGAQNLVSPMPNSGKKGKKGSDAPDEDSIFNVETPQDVPCVPLYKVPIFPTTIVPLIIRNKEFSDYLKKIHKSSKDKGLVGLFLAKPQIRTEQGDKPVDDLSQIYTTGTLGKITYLGQIQKNTVVAVISGIRRIKVKDEPNNAFKDVNERLRVKIEEKKTINKELLFSEQETDQSAKLKALILELLSDLKKLSKVSHYHRKEMIAKFLEELFVNDPEEIAYITTVLTSASPEEHQQILERDDLLGRLEMAIQMVQKEIQTEFFRTKLSERMMEAQKKNVLHEQLRFIKEELGMGLATNRFRERIASRNIPPKVMKIIEEEMNKLEATDSFSPDHAVISNYVDWLTKLPWGIYRTQTLDVEKAKKVLEEDHYGMKNVKERILEYIAVAKLKKGDFKGKIICLVGPPGVGKTSVGQSIARALNREFFRFSVGGMNQVSELKGHRRTYVGAMPGKFIQIFKQAQSQNPVIMIDEIDKMGASQIHGDPAAAMLEVLDPEQNMEFLDHFLDVPFDLSKTLFILTANDTSTIPKPLLDRVEIIDMNGYTAQEKLQIAKQYLIPKVEKENGISDKVLHLEDKTILKLIGEYCREAGVRFLEQQLEKLYRKVALKIEMAKIEEKKKKQKEIPAKDIPDPAVAPKTPQNEKEEEKEPEIKIEIKGDDIYKFLGKPRFTSDRFYEKTPPGVVMGLAWTPLGGALLFIESSAEPTSATTTTTDPANQKPKETKFSRNIRTTGGLGDVMKESTEIAYTYARRFFKEIHSELKENPDKFKNLSEFLKNPQEFNLEADFFDNSFIHMHFPEGAIKKDGPSAGVSICTSLISLALNRPAKHNLAMTGEITLTGKVLPVGGIKEKTLGGLRAGVTEIIFPKENKRDWDELEPHIKGDLKVHFVETYLDVFKIAFDYDSKENEEKIKAQKNAELF